VHYANFARTQIIRPEVREKDESKFNATATTLSSFPPPPSYFKPTTPIYPQESGAVIGAGTAASKGDYLSTAAASYCAHPVKRYVPPKRPVGEIAGVFG
jgi:hypothetical protein